MIYSNIAEHETPPSYQQICEIIIIKAHTKGEFRQEKSFIIKQMNNKQNKIILRFFDLITFKDSIIYMYILGLCLSNNNKWCIAIGPEIN